jgi:hypothetical protein
MPRFQTVNRSQQHGDDGPIDSRRIQRCLGKDPAAQPLTGLVEPRRHDQHTINTPRADSASICLHSAAKRMPRVVTMGCPPTGRRNSKQHRGWRLKGKLGRISTVLNRRTNVVLPRFELKHD